MTHQTMFNPGPLLYHPAFQRLLRIKQQVNPFSIFGIAGDEICHSRILSFILRSSGPVGIGHRLLPSWISSAADFQTLSPRLQIKLSAANLEAFTEYYCGDLGRIDVLLHDRAQKLVVVIENKIWAKEQDRQVERYQRFLATSPEWKDFDALVLYLTPSGALPTTNDPTSAIPCLSLSYESLAQALEGFISEDHSHVLGMFQQNIRMNIMAEKESRKIVQELLQNPEIAKVIYEINRNLPCLGDIVKDIKDKVVAFTQQDVIVNTWPSRGKITECQIFIKRWNEANLPFCFNFYHSEMWPSVRCQIHSTSWDTCQANFRALAAKHPSVLNPEFPVRSDWTGWRLVFQGDDIGDTCWKKYRVDDLSFSQATVSELIQRFQEQYNRVAPCVEQWICEGGFSSGRCGVSPQRGEART